MARASLHAWPGVRRCCSSLGLLSMEQCCYLLADTHCMAPAGGLFDKPEPQPAEVHVMEALFPKLVVSTSEEQTSETFMESAPATEAAKPANVYGNLESEHGGFWPNSCYCRLTRSIFIEPVLAMDGHTYEKTAIEDWLSKIGTSPATGQPLFKEQLIPNLAVREIIDELLVKQALGV